MSDARRGARKVSRARPLRRTPRLCTFAAVASGRISREDAAMDRQPMTLTQKILAAHARNLPRPWVQAGDVLQVSVDWTIASELAWNGMDRTYGLLGRPQLHDKDRSE